MLRRQLGRDLWRSALPAILIAGTVSCSDTDQVEPATPISADAMLAHIGFLADDSLYGRAAGWGDELRAAEYIRDLFEAAGLTPGVPQYLQPFWIGPQVAGADARAQQGDPDPAPDRPPSSYSQNVIATLAGDGDLAAEWVVVGAHYDHVGWSVAPDSSLQIFNGADDNASGTAVLLEVSRYLGERLDAGAFQTPRRSIMFIGFGAEEIGLVGSEYFCAAPTVDMRAISAMVNLDMVGRLRDALAVRASGSAPWWTARFREANTDGISLALDQAPMSGGSDHLCFLAAGRPAVHVFTGLHAEYHTPADDPPLINRDGLLKIANLTARLIEELATEPSLAVR
jgi:hypothetical protein